MINPLRSEEEAFRFLIGTIVYFGAITLASVLGGRWVGLVVFLALTGLVVAWWMRSSRDERPPVTAPQPHGENERRILVVANETVGGQTLRSTILLKGEGLQEHVLVVVPALNSTIRQWTSDEDGAREAAAARLEATLQRLKSEGVDARGEVGDGDPLQAIEDALRTFSPDEIIISTHPEGRSRWLEGGVVQQARERFAVLITHVVTDLEREGSG